MIKTVWSNEVVVLFNICVVIAMFLVFSLVSEFKKLIVLQNEKNITIFGKKFKGIDFNLFDVTFLIKLIRKKNIDQYDGEVFDVLFNLRIKIFLTLIINKVLLIIMLIKIYIS